MLPCLPLLDVPDCSSGNIVTSGNLCPGAIVSSDINDVLTRKLAANMDLSTWLSSFTDFVGNIVCQGAKKEMIRINTRRIVAAMENACIFWNLTIKVFVGESRGNHRNMSAPRSSDTTIAFWRLRTEPQPTPHSVGIEKNFIQEAFRHLFSLGSFFHRSSIPYFDLRVIRG